MPPRLAAALEVTAITALVWATYKAAKLIEPPGFNCAPGLTMLLGATGMLAWHYREFLSYGVVAPGWRGGLNLGILLSLLIIGIGMLELSLLPIAGHTPTTVPLPTALALAAIRIPLYLAALMFLARQPTAESLQRLPPAVSLAALIILLLAAPAYVILRGAPWAHVSGQALSLVVCTGLGEELFFRGYVQSRVNGVCGRPWRVLNAQVGPGLVFAALLFGLIHVFNPSQPFAGIWKTTWLWGVTASLSGLLYGYLRERTGSIWAGVIVHALTGEYRGLGQVFLPHA